MRCDNSNPYPRGILYPNMMELAALRNAVSAASHEIEISDLNFWYGETQSLKGVHMSIQRNSTAAIIGPSGCGKSTLLRCINRLNDLIPATRCEGKLAVGGENILGPKVDVIALRRKVGMVFQKPNPFPISVFENVVYGCKRAGIRGRGELSAITERALRRAALWDELKERLDEKATNLSGGQQQRLCIARALAMEPEVLLMDEPCSALDPISTRRIEELIASLKESCTIVIVTHNMGQAQRVSDSCAFMLMGELVEHGRTEQLFCAAKDARTSDYVQGRFG